MRLLYIHQYFKTPQETGGTRSFDLARGFVMMGHEVDVVTATANQKYKGRQKWVSVLVDGIRVHYIFLPYNSEMNYFLRVIVFFSFVWFASLKVLQLKADLVLATSTPLTIGIPAILKKFLQRTPYIFEIRDVWPEAVFAIGAITNPVLKRILLHLEEFTYVNAAAIVPLSTDMRASVLNRYPTLRGKPLVVIENIAEVNRFQKTGHDKAVCSLNIIDPKPRFTVLYAGSFGKVNGLKYAVDLAELLLPIDRSIALVLVGAGTDHEACVKYAKCRGVLNKNVFFLPPTNKDSLPVLYSQVDMGSSFVIPVKELWANSANKFFDTLAAGKPILINHGGWQQDVIRQENIGYVLPSELTETAARDFARYTSDKVLQEEQKRNALNKAVSDYSLENALSKYNKLLSLAGNSELV
jgi:glycosyltransferase involved in cell wall biosynthesis